MKQAVWIALASASLTACLTACSMDNLLNGDDPPEGNVIDPDAVTSLTGARGIYHSAIAAMATALMYVSEDVGVITDELATTGSYHLDYDTRADLNEIDGMTGIVADAYGRLQTARVRAAQASDVLLRYGNASTHPLVGHAYAMQAQTILLMAEMFCSGIPLTEVPFEGDIRYTPGLSTNELLERAVALFDTAHTYGKDSLPIATFAQVGKGRTLLNLGRYADAAAAVATVPTTAQYIVVFSSQAGGVRFWMDAGSGSGSSNGNFLRVLSLEGGNGIQWATPAPQDPRVPLTTTNPVRQQKFTSGTVNFVVADGIQARMIEAEAQLQPAAAPAGPWLATLNAARATRSLAPLTDPGTATSRVDLLFRERAFWFYLNGVRLGDLRRLVRQYDRIPNQVYPTGAHHLANLRMPTYGNEPLFVPHANEKTYNPLYQGCIDRRP